jgi:hypothetical protein
MGEPWDELCHQERADAVPGKYIRCPANTGIWIEGDAAKKGQD